MPAGGHASPGVLDISGCTLDDTYTGPVATRQHLACTRSEDPRSSVSCIPDGLVALQEDRCRGLRERFRTVPVPAVAWRCEEVLCGPLPAFSLRW
jgi:hypothetical protein